MGLVSKERPGSIDLLVEGSEKFPFDAWDFRDKTPADSTGVSLLRLKQPWVFQAQARVMALASVGYTVLDDDGVSLLAVTTGASDRTVVLPTLADNQGRLLRLEKTDSGAGKAIFDGEGTEKIGARATALTIELYAQGDWVEVQATSGYWAIKGFGFHELLYTPSFTGFGTPSSVNFSWVREGGRIKALGTFASGTPTAVEARVGLPGSLVSNSRLIASIVPCGIFGRDVAEASSYACLIEPGAGYITIGKMDAASSILTKVIANAKFGAGNVLTCQFEFPVWDE